MERLVQLIKRGERARSDNDHQEQQANFYILCFSSG
jgi:hypothetical protein